MLLPGLTRRTAAALLPASSRANGSRSRSAAGAMAAASASSARDDGGAARSNPSTARRPPRCAHVLLERDEPSLAAALARELGLPSERVGALMRLGAVHFCLVPPPLQPGGPVDASVGDAGAARARAAALERWGAHSRLSSPRRVYADLAPCPAHSFARVHLRPWRMPPPPGGGDPAAAAAAAMRLLHVSEGCVVVDKPPGLPVPPAVDNVVDCAAHLAAGLLPGAAPGGGSGKKDGAGGGGGGGRWGRGVRARGAEEAAILDALEEAAAGAAAPAALRPVHRLDTGTSGVLVLARTQAFASWWSGRQRARTEAAASVEEVGEGEAGATTGEEDRRHATKLYRCLTFAPHPPPPGTHVHWAITRYRPEEVEEEEEVTAAGGGGGGDRGAPPPPPLPERTLMFGSRAEADRFLAAAGPGARAGRLLRRAGGNAAAVTPAAAKRCELEVVSARRVGRLSPSARAAFCPGSGGEEEEGDAWEALVELRTGRTHQIRAQLAALGCPLAGDALYASSSSSAAAPPAGGVGGVGGGSDWQSLPLGLQAAELRVYDPEGRMGAASDGGWASFRAAPPWWWGEGEGDEEEGG